MVQGRWKPSDTQMAQEAYFVFVEGERPTRTYGKSVLMERLSHPSVYLDFLKVCIEYDDSDDLRKLRKGFLQVVRAIGMGEISKRMKLSRITLYRMLSKGGNPTLLNWVRLYRVLGLSSWIVDEEFIKRREQLARPKDLNDLHDFRTGKPRIPAHLLGALRRSRGAAQ